MKEICLFELIYKGRQYYRTQSNIYEKIKALFDTQKGWILIDAIIGITITITALVALMSLYTQITHSTASARDYQNANYIVQQHLENLRQFDGTATIRNLNPEITAPPNQTVEQVQYTIQIRSVTPIDTLDPRLIPYQVIVTWPDPRNASLTRSIQVVNYYFSN